MRRQVGVESVFKYWSVTSVIPYICKSIFCGRSPFFVLTVAQSKFRVCVWPTQTHMESKVEQLLDVNYMDGSFY